MTGGRFLGIFVPTVYLQDEGVDSVLDRLVDTGAAAVGLYARVGRPAAPGNGERFPDLHVDGFERTVDRPIWGRHELDIETWPAFQPVPTRYGGYRPVVAPIPPDVPHPDVVGATVDATHRRGMEAHLLVHPLLVPGLRAEDAPRSVAPSREEGRVVARTACPSSPDARAFAIGVARDAASVPGIDGLFLDWTEFRAYALGDLFACVCDHCGRRATALGYPWADIVSGVEAAWRAVRDAGPDDLAWLRHAIRTPRELTRLLVSQRALLAWLEFKARTITDLYREVRAALDADGNARVTLTARGWSPPWNLVSGLDYGAAADACAAVAPKLFTFDYAALPRWYGQALARWNPRLREEAILDTLVDVLDLPDDRSPRRFAGYQVPAAGEPHPTAPEAYAARVEEVVHAVSGRVPCYPIIHACLPEGQWKRMVAVVRDGPADGAWVQMYGYLSDAKLRILRDVWRARPA